MHKQFYTLPLEQGGFVLTLNILNKHSDFSYSKHVRLSIKKRIISFRNEVLVLGIRLGEEKEEQVYIRVLQTGLIVSCSTDTSSDYLSRYAYFALYSFLRTDPFYDFGKFYWPDFFSPKTGKSKYLTITTDGGEIDIKRKPQYAFFYKPGDKLIFPFKDKKEVVNMLPNQDKDALNQLNPYAIGYCLADTRLRSFRSAHFPFLVCYTAIWKENKVEIKNFKEFLMTPQQTAALKYTPMQAKINALCNKMQMLAPIKPLVNSSSEKGRQAIKRENIGTMKLVYALWRKTIPLLQAQPFTHHLHTFGMHHITGKPRKEDMQSCSFSAERPKLYFSLVDKGAYYELELRFKIGDKLYVPNEYSPTFFIHSKKIPYRYYLLDSITDYHVMYFFERHNFKMSVLKDHYPGRFKIFTDRLAQIYELNIKGNDGK